MIALQPMTQEEFDDYMSRALPHLASELAGARGLDPAAAADMAQESFRALFPEGKAAAADQYVFHVVAGGARVGALHYGVRRDRAEPYLYVWDIVIDDEHRGRGYGRETMAAVEAGARALGVRAIRLNVFGRNAVARALYEREGYEAESLVMVKRI
jgi:ribosomal protein S18 acetylase RimI-like enzyme